MIVVDTNVWSEATKAAPNAKVRAWAAENRDRLMLATVVLAELRAGVALLPSGKRRTALEGQIEAIVQLYSDRIMPFDEPASAAYAVVLERARKSGRPIQAIDAMVAATALANGMTIATRDEGDFAAVGVELINPWND